jgi:subtilase family serine protease
MRNLRSSLCLIAASTLLTTICAATLCFAEAPDRIGTISASQTTPLAKSLHPKAQPQFDLGPVEPSRPLSYITLLIAPSPSQQKALDQLLAQQQDPHSHNYHKWLTPAQFADRFGLSQNDLNKVTAWLKSQGFKVASVGGGRNSVVFSGTAAQVQGAFGTEIHNYKIDGEEHFANSTPVMVPAELGGVIKSVMGLHDFRPRPTYRGRGLAATRNFRSDYYDGNYSFPNFLAPGDVATIYDIVPLYALATPINGTGQKLAVMGQTDILLADINDFRNGFGLTPIPTGSGGCTTTTTGTTGIVIAPCTTTNFAYVLVGSDPLALGSDIMEADLDIEWSGAVASNAQIIFVNAPETAAGVNDSLNTAINPPSGPPVAPVISMSYGACEAQAQDVETLMQQGNAEGVTIMMASGDTGAAGCDYGPATADPPFPAASGGLAVNYPASSPEATGVGGTEITIADDTAPNTYWSAPTTNPPNGGTALPAALNMPEITWNDDVEFSQFCVSNPGSTFCTHGGSPAVPGWVDITSQETAQEDIWISAGGGGASNCVSESAGGICDAAPAGGFPQPTWQSTSPKLVISGVPQGVRWVPDVSLFASPNFPGYILCTPQNPPSTNASTCSAGIFDAVDTYESLVGGTSASTPVFAGIVTLLNQFLNGASLAGLGNINPKLYQLAAITPSNGAFHPVTSGTNIAYCAGATPSGQPTGVICPAPSGTTGTFGYDASASDPTTGYNLVNGLGSVDANALFNAWQASLGSFTLTPNPTSLAVIAGNTSPSTTITLTPSGSFNTPVTYSCSAGGVAGTTCNFTPSTATLSPVTLTIATAASMQTGAVPVTVSATGGGVTETTTVTLNVSATNQTFQLAQSGSATLQVNPGQTGTAFIGVTGTNGFSTAITFSCIDPAALLASGATPCAITPATPTTTFPVSLTIPTAAPTAQLHPPLGRGTGIFYAVLLPGLLGIVFTAGSRKRAARGIRFLSLIVVLGFSTLWLGSCSSNSNSNKSPGTPAGSYIVTVNATTGGVNPVTATTTVTLVVQ